MAAAGERMVALGELIANHTDIPDGVVNVLSSSDAGVGAAMTTSPDVDVITFTGSTAVGRRIMADASATVKRVFLELGGKSAVIMLDDAVRIANNSIYGLAGAVFSRDQDRALGVARRIRTGSVSINGGNYFGADSPFGGFKQSGVGREMGVAGLEEFLERKAFAVAAGPAKEAHA